VDSELEVSHLDYTGAKDAAGASDGADDFFFIFSSFFFFFSSFFFIAAFEGDAEMYDRLEGAGDADGADVFFFIFSPLFFIAAFEGDADIYDRLEGAGDADGAAVFFFFFFIVGFQLLLLLSSRSNSTDDEDIALGLSATSHEVIPSPTRSPLHWQSNRSAPMTMQVASL
jgi:hypothetical protein